MTTRSLSAVLAVLLGGLLAATAPSQQASFTTFGTPCTAANSTTPAIGNRGLPRLGTTMAVTYSGPNSIEPGIQLTEHPMLIVGFSRVDLPIPPLIVTQPAGCTLYPSLDVVLPTAPAVLGRAYVPSINLSVPNDSRLLGGVLYLQWMTPRSQCTFVGCGLLWVVLSDAARAVIGT